MYSKIFTCLFVSNCQQQLQSQYFFFKSLNLFCKRFCKLMGNSVLISVNPHNCSVNGSVCGREILYLFCNFIPVNCSLSQIWSLATVHCILISDHFQIASFPRMSGGAAPVKKGRGRPPKTKVDSLAEIAKKPRGRPASKSTVEARVGDGGMSEEEDAREKPANKRRGRPTEVFSLEPKQKAKKLGLGVEDPVGALTDDEDVTFKEISDEKFKDLPAEKGVEELETEAVKENTSIENIFAALQNARMSDITAPTNGRERSLENKVEGPTVTLKKPRGRPTSKFVDAEDTGVEEKSKGRGQDQTATEVSSEDSLSTTEDVVVKPVKKNRGRPRKEPTKEVPKNMTGEECYVSKKEVKESDAEVVCEETSKKEVSDGFKLGGNMVKVRGQKWKVTKVQEKEILSKEEVSAPKNKGMKVFEAQDPSDQTEVVKKKRGRPSKTGEERKPRESEDVQEKMGREEGDVSSKEFVEVSVGKKGRPSDSGKSKVEALDAESGVTDAMEVVVKKKRGRPSKIGAEKKSRESEDGREEVGMKEGDVGSMESVEVSVKKKGRPSDSGKSEVEALDGEGGVTDAMEVVVKKKRGRPSKIGAEKKSRESEHGREEVGKKEGDVGSMESVEVSVKKKGQPSDSGKKDVEALDGEGGVTETMEVVVKKKRGRSLGVGKKKAGE